jgi:imidazolonepropionase-like amidohydrolase
MMTVSSSFSIALVTLSGLLGGATPWAAPPAIRQQAGASLALHASGARVGEERATTARTASGTRATYETTLRLGPGVDVSVTLATSPDGSPAEMRSAGRALPWLLAPSSWTAARGARVFPIDGPFPIGAQGALARWWRAAGRPDTVQSHRGVALTLRPCQVDPLPGSAAECVSIGGLTWGRSMLWLDRAGEIVAAYVPTVLGKVIALPPADSARVEDVLRRGALAAGALDRRIPRVASPRARPVAIRGGTVLDVVAGTQTRDAVVVVEGERIAAVGPADSTPIPAGAEVLDASGATILPGLWDMHAHLRHADWGPAYLAAGVTTARDLGNDLPFVRELRRLYAGEVRSGPGLLIAGWVDDTPRTPYPAYQASTPAAGVELVRRHHASGVEQIKVWEYLRPDVLRAVAAEAHRLGLRVGGHVPDGMSLLGALDAGMDEVHHVDHVIDALDAAERLPDSLRALPALAQHLARRGTVLDATLVIPEFRGHALGRSLAALEPGLAFLPPDMARANELLRGPASNAADGERRFRRALEVVRALHAAGVPIVAGTDQGVPGFSLLRELELYVLAGLSPLDAIRAATIVPARVMRRDGEVGRIAVGMRADLVVVDGDPLADISAIRRTRLVVRRGDAFNPTDLRRAIDFAPVDPAAVPTRR